VSNATLSPIPFLHSVRLIIHIMLDKALPQNSDYLRTFEANGISAPQINLTGLGGYSARIGIPKGFVAIGLRGHAS